jgi:UDP-2-acetamido-2-deoxy-ribo-hexuluronate aminotransferase
MNSRLDTVQAAIVLPKLGILDEEIAARLKLADAYGANLHGTGIAPPEICPHNRSASAQYTIWLQDRASIQAALAEAGIPTAMHYPLPLSRQPAVAVPAGYLPNGDRASAEVLSLPMHPYMSIEDNARIAEALAGAVEVLRDGLIYPRNGEISQNSERRLPRIVCGPDKEHWVPGERKMT